MQDRDRTVARNRQTLRRLTVAAAGAAIGLNAVLLIQTSVIQVGPGAVQDAIVSFFGAVFPGGGLRAAQPPAAPSASPLVVTGAS